MGEDVTLKAADGHEFSAYVARPEGAAMAGLGMLVRRADGGTGAP